MAVSYPEYEVLPAVDPWQALVMLHYLSMAGGAPMEGKMIAFSEYRDGLARGYGFDRDTENAIRERAGALSEDELKKRCLALGGRLVASNADLCVEFKFMPNYPVWLKIWFADDEFPASGKIFVDASGGEVSEHRGRGDGRQGDTGFVNWMNGCFDALLFRRKMRGLVISV